MKTEQYNQIRNKKNQEMAIEVNSIDKVLGSTWRHVISGASYGLTEFMLHN